MMKGQICIVENCITYSKTVICRYASELWHRLVQGTWK